jgi:hypothetical protein
MGDMGRRHPATLLGISLLSVTDVNLFKPAHRNAAKYLQLFDLHVLLMFSARHLASEVRNTTLS